MKITMIIGSMALGGAERVFSILANCWAKKGWTVTLLTFDDNPSFFRLHPAIKYQSLGIHVRSRFSVQRVLDNFWRLGVLRRAIKKSDPQVVVSFLYQTNVHTIISAMGLDLPVVVSERNDPELEISSQLWGKLRRISYPFAAKVVSVTQGVDSYFDWLPRKKRVVIYNPMLPAKECPNNIILPVGIDPDKDWLIAMGRLTYQKGFDILLGAFKKIADKYPGWQVLIFGEGELRKELEKMRKDFGLENRVIMPGIVQDPFPFLKRSKIFVMPSRYEGFPNSLGEAMACGLPAVSFDCPSGPAEIVRDGIDGVLVSPGDVNSLAKALDGLMGNEAERNRLASRAAEVTERFSLQKTIEGWQDLIEEVAR